MDVTGYQLNNEVGKIISMKGAKDVHSLTLSHRSENMSVVAPINAE